MAPRVKFLGDATMTNEQRGVSSEIIQRIREQVDLVDLISTYVSLKKAGQNFKGLCPFHSEKSPSFSVNPSSQFFHCFGCQAGGDAFSFLMKQEGMTFIEALRELSQRTGIPLPERRAVSPKRESTLSRERYMHLYQLAKSFYHQNLLESPSGEGARQYLIQRGITTESWKIFQLGFAPAGWNGLSKWMEGQSISPQELVSAGLIVQKTKEGSERVSTYDRFRDRVMFPIDDSRGGTIGFGGRVMKEEEIPKYLNSPETGLFSKGKSLYGLHNARRAAMAEGRFFLVEGYFDVIALHQHGVENAVAPLGTALTGEHIQILRRLVPAMTLVFDGDVAGKNAALRTLDLFLNAGVDVRVLVLPAGEDPDSFIRTQGVPRFRELEDRAQTLLDFAIASVLDGVQLKSVQDRVQRADDILRILQKTKNPLEKDEYLKIVSERLGLRQDLLRKRLPTLRYRVETKRPSVPSQDVPQEFKIPKGKPEERDILILLLQGRLEVDQLEKLKEIALTVPVYREVLRQALRFQGPEGQVDLEAFRGSYGQDPSYGTVIAQLSVWDLYVENIRDHVQGCFRVLENRQLQESLDEVIAQLKVAERDGRQGDVDALVAKIDELRGKKASLMVSS